MSTTNRPTTPSPRGSVLGAVVFVSSAAVLVLEILAARVLAPHVGLSLQSFTAIIGTILAAIALGAWAGGSLADRRAPEHLLGPVLLLGGVLSIAMPAAVDLLGRVVHGHHPLKIVTLAAIGFFAPAMVLSMVTPIAAKLALSSVTRTGAVVGTLTALSTLGALVGTFVTGFWLLGLLPSRPITWVVGGLALAMGVPLSWPRARRLALGAGAATLLAIAGSAQVSAPCSAETRYYCAQVRADGPRDSSRSLFLDSLRHGRVDLVDRSRLDVRYIRTMAHAAEALAPRMGEALYLGAGSFTLPMYFQHTRGARATVLELDPQLQALAVRELGLSPGPWLRLRAGDARITARALPDAGVDVVFGDAFSTMAVPFHLATEEFARELRRVLRPGGRYVLNVVDRAAAQLIRAELATLARVFQHLALVAPPTLLSGRGGGNYVVIASDAPIDRAALAAAMTDGERVLDGAALNDFIGGAAPLTDAHAPVDQLLAGWP